MSLLRRYEVLVPLVYNDGTAVPEPLVAETFAELRAQFGAASWETQSLRGVWGGTRGQRLPGQSYTFLCGCSRHARPPRVFHWIQRTLKAAFQSTGRLDYFSPGGRDLTPLMTTEQSAVGRSHLEQLDLPDLRTLISECQPFSLSAFPYCAPRNSHQPSDPVPGVVGRTLTPGTT